MKAQLYAVRHTGETLELEHIDRYTCKSAFLVSVPHTVTIINHPTYLEYLGTDGLDSVLEIAPAEAAISIDIQHALTGRYFARIAELADVALRNGLGS